MKLPGAGEWRCLIPCIPYFRSRRNLTERQASAVLWINVLLGLQLGIR